MTDTLEQFEEFRPLMFSIAYRMLGSVVEAEDIVQEAFVRYQGASPDRIDHPKAFLTTVVTRLCLDQLKSAKTRREVYPGVWLPEPRPTELSGDELDPEDRVGMAQSISMAVLVLLESLTPTERAVFLLREVFDYSYDEIAAIVGKSEAACRQLFHRSRQYVADRRPRFSSTTAARRRLTDSFVRACTTGDLDGLLAILSDDITIWSDGGGKAMAAPRPIHGRDRVARFLVAIVRKSPPGVTVEVAEINGAPGIISRLGGVPIAVFVLETDGDLIRGIRAVVNPDKLSRLGSVASPAEGRSLVAPVER